MPGAGASSELPSAVLKEAASSSWSEPPSCASPLPSSCSLRLPVLARTADGGALGSFFWVSSSYKVVVARQTSVVPSDSLLWAHNNW